MPSLHRKRGRKHSLHTQKNRVSVCGKNQQNPWHSFPRAVVTSKATGKWRATYEGLGTYLTVPNLIQRAFQTNTTVWFSTSQEPSPSVNAPETNKVTLKFFHISGSQHRLKITNLPWHIVLYAAHCEIFFFAAANKCNSVILNTTAW